MAALFIAFILGALLLLGSRQYRAHKYYENIIEQNEKIIFQFATIREHISESLLENKYQQLSSITKEVEGLNANISRILQEPFIPDEYKLSFVGQIDLAGITILLRGVSSGDASLAKIRELNQEIRILGDRLMLFDRVIVNQVKRKLVAFQSTVIGILAMVLFVVIYILLFWHHRIAVPLLDLIKQLKEVRLGKRNTIKVRRKSGEIALLTDSIQQLHRSCQLSADALDRINRLLVVAGKSVKLAQQTDSRDAIFSGICKELLTIEDYCLAWFGIQEDNNRVRPVLADGSTTMSRQECDECMEVLLAAAENNKEKNAAMQALTSRRPVVIKNLLNELPRGPFKNTPLAEGSANCAAIPLVLGHRIYGVITIYSTSADSFAEPEIEILSRMNTEIALLLQAKNDSETNRLLGRLNSVWQDALTACSDLILITDENLVIRNANQSALDILHQGGQDINGRDLLDVLHHEQVFAPPQQLLDAIRNRTVLELHLPIREKEFFARIIPLPPDLEGRQGIILIARDAASEETASRADMVRASKLAAIGELAVSVAHEINNLSNTLINNSQILSDELTDNGEDSINHRTLLNNIINEGERIAHIVQQLLFFNTNRSTLIESVQIENVVNESLALISHQLQQDGIQTKTNFPKNLPPVRTNVQKMHHVFLNLLSNARYALNHRYPGQHPDKLLEIRSETFTVNGQQWLRVNIKDQGNGIEPSITDKIFEPFYSTKPAGEGTGLGLSICQGLVQDNSGVIKIDSKPREYTTISVELPLTEPRM